MSGRAVLVAVDMLNAFVDPAGRMYVPDAPAVATAVSALLRTFRQRGLPVVHAHEEHLPGAPDYAFRKLPEQLLSGTWEAEPASGFAPVGDEIRIRKRRFSAFRDTDLLVRLRELGCETLVVAGVKTNVCVRATVQDACGEGFDIVVPREAVGSNRPHLHEASLEDIDRYMGRVLTLAEVLALVERGSRL